MSERTAVSSVRFRHRLWGAIVLLALAVIILPLLFDGSGSERHFRAVEGLVDEPPLQAARSPSAPAVRHTPSTASAARLTGSPRAWVVQAGSFRRQDYALALRDRLRSSGLPCFVTPHGHEASIFRVNVGPMIDAKRARSVRTRVAELTGQPALLIRYP